MASKVPTVESLEDVYDTGVQSQGLSSGHTQRWQNLTQSFSKEYGHKPEFVARSPGRVNIIGEHVDYSLYNVLPTAVQVDVLVAVRVTGTQEGDVTIKVANTNSQKYPSRTITVPRKGDVEVDKEDHQWSNYFKAGLSGSISYLRKELGDTWTPRGMEVLVDGNVPAGSGLSSSAAFVCASALSVMRANDHDVSKQDLLDLCIVSERLVGVFSGGMDQAASIFSERNFLLYCRFWPKFSEEHVAVPKANPDVTFLIAQSFVTSDKAVTATQHYNLRVVECTLAAVVLAKMHDISLNPDDSPLGFSLRNLQEEVMKKNGRRDIPIERQVEDMIVMIKSKLDKDSYTREEMADILGLSVENLEKAYMSKFPVEAESFKLRQRALHVLQEAQRVLAFKATLHSAEDAELDQQKLHRLGDLMNETQTSCRDVYECSCPELDEICSIARKAGAYGSRLTGAGWGGCTVHLVPTDRVSAVTEALTKQYYSVKFPDLSEEKMKDAIVISKPGTGSTVITGKGLDV